MGQPFFMALSELRVRFRRAVADVPVHPVLGTRAATVDQEYGDIVEMRGQPRYKKNKRATERFTGDAEDTDGYVVFAYDELERVGIVNADDLKHARIVGVMRRGTWCAEDYQIVQVQHRGHLAGGPIIVKAHFRIHKDLRGAA